jgi:ABC-type bacteriocin/lantibiotic exporter with double-glycine peptidase domain
MNIVFSLFSQFLVEEKVTTFLMIFVSFIISILQSGFISYTTANILKNIQKFDESATWGFFKYFMIISTIYIAIYSWYKHYQIKFLTKLRQWIRVSLVKMLLKINNENFSDMNFVNLNSPINRVSTIIYGLLDDCITYVLPYFTFFIMMCIYFIYKNAIFGIGFFIGNVILLTYCYLNIDESLDYNSKYEELLINNEKYLLDILNNMDKIVYRGQVDIELEKYDKNSNEIIDAAYKLFNVQNYHELIANIIMYIILFVSIGYLIIITMQKKVDVTIFITFFTILLLYREKMTTLVQQIPSYVEFIGRVESVLRYFNNTEKDYDAIQNQKYEDVKLEFNMIQFKNVSFRYSRADIPIYENKNLVLHTNNKIIGITGLSGNGKSTFAKLILKMYKPDSGHILIDNVDLSNIDTAYIRKNITYVNQNSKLFDIKIIDNILYGCNNLDACNGHLEEIMKYPKIRELYRNQDLKNGQSGSLGENLSGGQRQVVNLISGLINPCKILILDEPTNALDPALKKEILELIIDFKKYKKCIMIITHDKDVFPIFNESIKL